MRLLASLLLAALTACATANSQPDDRFTVEVRDRPERELFEVSLTSHSSERLCLSPEFWPNSHGSMPAAPQTATVAIGADRFPIDGDYNAGFCPGDECAVRVPPGSTITGIILYQRFGIPRHLVQSPKLLEFHPSPYAC